MLLNPIFSPLVQSQTNSEQTLKRRHTDNSNESSSSLLTVASDVANVFANQLNSTTPSSSTTTISSSSKSQISTCHLCGKKFQTNDYLQLHLMNKHQISTDIQTYDSQQQRTKLSNSIKSSNQTLNSNTVKKIKLETNETPSTTITTTVIKASSPIDTITSPNPVVVIPGIVDTYFAAKMADRVSCDICHKVNQFIFTKNLLILFVFSKYVINIFLKHTNSNYMGLVPTQWSLLHHQFR